MQSKSVFIKTKGKRDGQRQPLSNEAVVIEKIAYDLLELFGVNVPETYIVEKKKRNGKIQLGLASEYDSSFVSLSKALSKSEEVKENLDLHDCIKEQRAVYENQELPFEDLFEAVPALLAILDLDAFGYWLINAGFVKSKKEEKLQFLKIDPAEASIGLYVFGEKVWDDIQTNFKNSLDPDLEKGLILNILKDYKAHYGEKDAVQRIAQLFAYAKKDQKLLGIARVARVTKKDIEKVVNRPEYKKYLSYEKRYSIIETMAERVSAYNQIYGDEIANIPREKLGNLAVKEQNQKILPIENFVRTIAKTTKGCAKPHLYIFYSNKVQEDFKSKTPIKDTTLLHRAVSIKDYKERKSIEAIIDSGVDVNARDRFGRPPLYYAVKFGSAEVIRYLIKKGAKKDVKPKNPGEDVESILHVAAQRGDPEIFELLVHQGFSMEVYDESNRTPYDVAKKYKQNRVIRWYKLKDDHDQLKRLLAYLDQLQWYISQRSVRNDDPNVKKFNEFYTELKNEIVDREKTLDLKKRCFYDAFKHILSAYTFVGISDQKNNVIINAHQFYQLTRDFENMIKRYLNNHKSFFGIAEQRLQALERVKSIIASFNEKIPAKEDPVKIILGAFVNERNKANEHHYSSSCFSFFTQSSLAQELNNLLRSYKVDPSQESEYEQSYLSYKQSLSLLSLEIAH